MPAVLRVILAALCLGVPFWGCSGNPFEEDAKRKDDPQDSGFVLAQGALQGSARAAADLHQEASAEDGVQEKLAAAKEPEVKPEVGATSIGAPKGDPVLSKGTRPKSIAAGALLKAGPGLAKASPLASFASLLDTLVLSDSAQGWIYGIRTYAFIDTAGGRSRPGQGRDSTRFRWPHAKANPAVLSFDRRRVFDDGTVETGAAHDDDGDGLLSEAAGGKAVSLRREWSAARGDSVWLSRVLTEHGQTTHFDSLGAGRARTWSDTLKVGGKVAWWRKVYDADGDGFVATAAAGAPVKIGSDSYADVGGGRIRFGTETHGPGPDRDYARDADNERYSASAYTVDAAGKDVNRSLSGDADGDGLLWSPVPGAANRSWEVTTWQQPPGDWQAYRDSAAKAADGRLSAYRADAGRADGSRLVLSVASLDGTTPFGPADTVLLTERLAFPAGDAERRDSAVKTAHLIPGRLDDPSDDLLLRWTARVHYNAASEVSLREESFVCERPVAPGAAAAAGSHVVEERRRGNVPGQPLRTWKRRDFDQASGTSAWKEIRNFAGGDSTVASGKRLSAGGGTFVTHTGKGLKASGWYDPATGAFKDTVAWLDSAGKPRGTRTGAGTWKAGVGEYTATVTRAGGGKVEVKMTGTAGEGGARSLVRISGSDTARWTAKGDTVRQERSFGKAKVAFTLARKGGGAWSLALAGEEQTGAKVLAGALEFGADGSGAGSLTPYEKGKAKAAVAFRADPDGAILLDGKPVP